MGRCSYFGVEDQFQNVSKTRDSLEILSVATRWEELPPLLAKVESFDHFDSIRPTTAFGGSL
jgi:hypothetical protein